MLMHLRRQKWVCEIIRRRASNDGIGALPDLHKATARKKRYITTATDLLAVLEDGDIRVSMIHHDGDALALFEFAQDGEALIAPKSPILISGYFFHTITHTFGKVPAVVCEEVADGASEGNAKQATKRR